MGKDKDRGTRTFAGRLIRDVRGSVGVYMALGFVFLLPLGAVAIDFTRYLDLNTEMNQAAQAAALAAAAELNLTPDGLTAAIDAAQNEIVNYQSFATDADRRRTVAITDIDFLKALPPEGQDNYAFYETTSAAAARYVRVMTEIRGLDSGFFSAYQAVIASAGNDIATKYTQGSAVAGKTTIVCRITPMMMCNPAEDYTACGRSQSLPGGSSADFRQWLMANPWYTRRQIRGRFIGPNADLDIPGEFGWLEPANAGPGTAALREEMANDTPESCVDLGLVQVQNNPGQRQGAVDGLNVRFDIFSGPLNKLRSQPGYSAAPNVVKGFEGSNVCKASLADVEDPVYSPLPLDDCFTTDPLSCTDLFGATPGAGVSEDGVAGRIGGGDWNAVRYFRANQPNMFTPAQRTSYDRSLAPPTPYPDQAADLANIAAMGGVVEAMLSDIQAWYELDGNHAADAPDPTHTASLAEPPSRYAVYRAELACGAGCQVTTTDSRTYQLNVPGPTRTGAAEIGNGGAPGGCSTQPPGPYDRRLLYVAVANCCELSQLGYSGKFGFPVGQIAETFLTQPVQKTGTNGDMGSLYFEVVRVVNAADSDLVTHREFVQLY